MLSQFSDFLRSNIDTFSKNLVQGAFDVFGGAAKDVKTGLVETETFKAFTPPKPNMSVASPSQSKPLSSLIGGGASVYNQSLNVDKNASVQSLDMSGAPAIDNSGATSNIKTQSDAFSVQIKDIQDQVLKIQTSANELAKVQQPPYGTNDSGLQKWANENPEAFDKWADSQGWSITQKDAAKQKSSLIDKLGSFLGTKQEEIQKVQQTPLPTLEQARNSYLAGLGFTPESMRETADLNNQLSSINKQVVDLDTQKNLALERIENRPGMTLEFMSGEQRRVAREYAIQQAGLGGKASALSAQIGILTGAYDKAQQAAQDYIQFATTERRQAVQDIQWAMSFYSTLFTTLDKSEQDKINKILDRNVDLLKVKADKAQNEIMNQIRATELSLSESRLAIDQSRLGLEQLKVGTELQEKADIKLGEEGQSLDNINRINNLLSSSALSKITGLSTKLGSRLLGGVEAAEEMLQIKGILDLGASKLIKGQGAVSNFERETISKATNALGLTNKGTTILSREATERQLKQIRGALQSNAGLPVNIKLTDKDGNFEYVQATRETIEQAIKDGLRIEYE